MGLGEALLTLLRHLTGAAAAALLMCVGLEWLMPGSALPFVDALDWLLPVLAAVLVLGLTAQRQHVASRLVQLAVSTAAGAVLLAVFVLRVQHYTPAAWAAACAGAAALGVFVVYWVRTPK